MIGFTDLESRVAAHSSQMYARNVANFLLHLVHDGRVELDLDDEIVSFPLVAHAGRVVAESPQGGA